MTKISHRFVNGTNLGLSLIVSTWMLAGCAATSDQFGEFSANPVLETNQVHVGTGGIDASRVNGGPPGNNAVDFVSIIDNQPAVLTVSTEEFDQNIAELQQAGVTSFNSDAPVTISFEQDDLKFVVKQLLGGLLSANYAISEDVEGTVTFKTETPVPRSAIPSIVRDMLARNGYVMKLINGVYQIGTPEMISVLESSAAAGVAGDLKTRVIKLERGNIEEIAAVAAQVLPAGTSITPVLSSNSLVLRINAADEKTVMGLINALVDNSNKNDIFAVIPIRESAPETVAATLGAYFQSSGRPASAIPLIIPLEAQQSLLVIAQSQKTLKNVRTMIRGLDKNNRDTPSLRIIPLKSLQAFEIADQLNKVFATGAAQVPQTPADDNNTSSEDADNVENSDSVVAPAIIRGSSNANSSNPENETTVPAARFDSYDAAANASQEVISIVPDTRNNTLLVRSSFSKFKRIREIVEALDVPLAQVVIEATIVEVELNDSLQYGVQAFLRGRGVSIRSSKFPDPADSGLAGGSAIFEVDVAQGLSATFVLEALQTVTDLKIISSPYLTVLDGRPARLTVGDQIPFLVQQTDAEQDGTTTTTNAIEVRDVGIILEVTPSIRGDNSVLLNVEQEVSSAQATGGGENLTPVISQRAISSDVVVASGKTILLGGLIQDRSEKIKTGVPGVSKLPLIGRLFQQRENVTDRTELLVMITPRVVRSSLQLDTITRQLRSRSAINQF